MLKIILSIVVEVITIIINSELLKNNSNNKQIN